MKTLKKSILLLTSFVMAMSAASCVNNELTEPEEGKAVKELATIDEQVASMEATVADLEALQTSAEGLEDELAGVVSSLESHIADLKAGASLLDGTLATLDLQKELAEVMASVESDDEALTKDVASVDKRAKSWLGKHFGEYYSAAKAGAVAAARLASLDFKSQKLYVEAILSDVEAGLRKDADKDELTALAASVNGNMTEAEELVATLSATTAEVLDKYTETVEAAVNDASGLDLPSLKQFNSNVAATLSAADNSLAGLIARVEACEAQLDDIKSRLGDLEEDIKNFDGLLDMIQSVTFMSKYSEDRIIAYYELDKESEERTEEGYMRRTKAESIALKYIVRPAAAAQALTEKTLWNDGLKVMGYYAEAITKAAPDMEEFVITDVTADENGIVTVTVNNTLSDDFYFKKTGAKMALSITNGKTDLVSKFVEIVPKDASNTIYAESLLVVTDAMEIEMNETVTLKTIVSPSGADQTVIWKLNDETVAKVTDEGMLTGVTVGTVTLTATTAVTDEWGRTLTGTCAVKVNPDMKIVGPKYVEQGYAVNLEINSPRNINPESITWTVSDPDAISIEKTYDGGLNRAVVTGEKAIYDGGYKDIIITCDIAGEVTLTHTMQCVEIQPKVIKVEGLADSQNEITLKFGESRNLGFSVEPVNVDGEKFKVTYGTSEWDNGTGVSYNGSIVVAFDEKTLKDGKTAGVLNLNLNSAYYWYDRTIQQSATPLTREIAVNVEPYYVTDLSIPLSLEMTLGQVMDMPEIILTSDIDGHDPSYEDLVWSSDNPEQVSVTPDGELTAKVLTNSVRITATVPEKSVKPGMTIQRDCYITVIKSADDQPKIGDYYYADGTWSTTLTTDANNPVIGVIFSLINATKDDTMLRENYGGCVHGLVLSLTEYSNTMGYLGVKTPNSIMTYPYDKDKTVGFMNTQQLSDWGLLNGETLYDNYGTLIYYAQMYRRDKHGVPALMETLEDDVVRSLWYIPSFYEMLLIKEQLETINPSLSNAGGTIVKSDGKYWTSSFVPYSKNNADIDGPTLFNMASGDWDSPLSSNGYYSANQPVRVILAF